VNPIGFSIVGTALRPVFTLPGDVRDAVSTFIHVVLTGQKNTLYLYGGQSFQVLDRNALGEYTVRVNNKVTVCLYPDGTYSVDGVYCGVLRNDLQRGVLR
jgi:hypothetical protein